MFRVLALLQSKAGDYWSRKCFLPLLNSPINSVNFMFSRSSLAGSISGVLILSGRGEVYI